MEINNPKTILEQGKMFCKNLYYKTPVKYQDLKNHIFITRSERTIFIFHM